MQQYRPTGFKLLPEVVKNLLIINGLMFLATIALEEAFGIDLINILGLHYLGAEEFQPYQIITYMFMHGGFGHILLNMFALWMFGYALENVWGPKRFLIYYIITGIGAAAVHYIIVHFQLSPTLSAINSYMSDPSPEKLTAFFNSSNFKIYSQEILANAQNFMNEYNSLVTVNPSKAMEISLEFMRQYKVDLLNAPVIVGASGAVFGILLAFGMMFPNTRIYVYFAFPIKAKYFVMIYGAIELFAGISNTQGDNVAHFAHLGGMIFGYFLIIYWNKKIKK